MINGNFKATSIISSNKTSEGISADEFYWTRIRNAAVIQENGAVRCVAFSPVAPFNLASVSSTKVAIYNSSLCEPIRELSRFKRAACCVAYRPGDGRLLTVGDEEGKVRVYDSKLASKTALRQYNGHQGAVYCCKFANSGTGNNNWNSVLSFSDDATIRQWDVSESDPSVSLRSYTEHKDRVRAGATSFSNSSLFISGSYDHTCRLWDCRSGHCSIVMNHGCPVESVIFFPNDSIVASAGGTTLKIWDLSSPDDPVASISCHSKTISSLCFCTDFKRIVSCSLDKTVKILDVSTYRQVFAFQYSSPVLSVAMSPDDQVMAVGMGNSNLLSIERRSVVNEDSRRRSTVASEFNSPPPLPSAPTPKDSPTSSTKPLLQYDRLLRSFKDAKALTSVVSSSYYVKRRPEVVVSVLRELKRRGTLSAALAGRQYRSLAPILRFIARYIHDTRFNLLLVFVTNSLIDVYSEQATQLDSATMNLFKKLLSIVEREVKLQQQLLIVGGAVQLVANGGKVAAMRGTCNRSIDSQSSTSSTELSQQQLPLEKSAGAIQSLAPLNCAINRRRRIFGDVSIEPITIDYNFSRS